MVDAEARKELFDFLVKRYFNGRRPDNHTVRFVAVQTGIAAPSAANDEAEKNPASGSLKPPVCAVAGRLKDKERMIEMKLDVATRSDSRARLL